MSEIGARVLFVILMVWAVTAVFYTTGWAKGKIVFAWNRTTSATENEKVHTGGEKRTDIPTWWEMTKYHGHEKILLGLLNSGRYGKDPQTQMRHIPEKVLEWLAWFGEDLPQPHWKTVKAFAKKLRAEEE